MKKILTQIIKKTPLYYPLRNCWKKIWQNREILAWEMKGKPVPPPSIIKQRTLEAYAKKFNLTVFVETGTYYGDTVEAMKNIFNQIYSIELSRKLHEKAKKRFKGVKHIELINGDSGVELEKLIRRIDRPTLFWLDGHYSGGETAKADKETPIYEELNCIFNTIDRGDVIIIDDARNFGTVAAYPNIEELNNFIRSKRPATNIDIQDDMIRITPK